MSDKNGQKYYEIIMSVAVVTLGKQLYEKFQPENQTYITLAPQVNRDDESPPFIMENCPSL